METSIKCPGIRLLVPADSSAAIPPAVEEQLTERHRKILEKVVADGSVTSGRVSSSLEVTRDTAVRDLNRLCELQLLERRGRGRSVNYALKAEG